jgi:uncharacterized membrane protein YraQ (UPF0718 family)
MIFGLFETKKGSCQVHGSSEKTANRTLLFMIVASFSLIVWHVWLFGSSSRTLSHDQVHPAFFPSLGMELRDLLFGPHGVAAELWDVLPYFVVGILLAGYIRTSKLAVKLRSTLGRHGFLSVFLASLIGILTPLCACGTLTTAISLLFAGMPLAPVISLLVTSPLLSPSTYLLTLNDLGPEWTVIRTIAAFSMGMFAGTVTHLLRNKGFRTDSIFIEGAIPRGDFHDEEYPDERLRCGCKEKFGNRVAARTDNKFVIFLAKSSEMTWLVGKYVLVGVFIGSIAERYIPYDWMYSLFGRKDPFNIIWVTLGTIPLFLHQISVSSILYHVKSSLDGTLDGGAALAFMIGGPVTAIPTMILFWTVFKKRVFFLYLSVCIIGTLMIAYGFRVLVFVPYVDTGSPLLRDVKSLSGGNSSVIEKLNKNIRIVMDPDGKGTIAVYSNDAEGFGPIVFDSGPERFYGSSGKYDDLTYRYNVAQWLNPDTIAVQRKPILVYDMLPGKVNSTATRKRLVHLENKGFSVVMTNRNETPVLSETLLNDYGQLWLFSRETNSALLFSDTELEAISRFNKAGGGMLVVTGPCNGPAGCAAANQVSTRYGVTFSGSVSNREEIPAATSSWFSERTARLLGTLLKLVNKA